jgi:hypothetical protein
MAARWSGAAALRAPDARLKPSTGGADARPVERRGALIRMWLLLGLLAAVIVAPLIRPLRSGWLCLARYDGGERASAVVVSTYERSLVLRLTSGAHRDAACTAKSSETPGAPGDALRVVYSAERGQCVAEATLERSRAVLWALTSGVGCVLLLILAVGAGLHRALRRPGSPQRLMPVESGSVVCPACGGKMAEGYLVLLSGVHWREPGQPLGLPHALSGLPGTVGWRGRPRLHAFRCTSCEILTAQYGIPRTQS